MGIFDFYYSYSKPSSAQTSSGGSAAAIYKTAAAASATPVAKTLNQIQSKLPPGSTVEYNPGKGTVIIFNPNAPYDPKKGYDFRTVEFKGTLEEAAQSSQLTKTVNAAAQGKQIVSFDIISSGQVPLAERQSPEATMTTNKPGEYRLTYKAQYSQAAGPEITLEKVRNLTRGVPIENVRINPQTGLPQKQVLNPQMNLIGLPTNNQNKGTFLLGASEQVGAATDEAFKRASQLFPNRNLELTGAKFLIGDLPRFGVKYGEALVLRGQEELSLLSNPRKYLKGVVAEQEGALSGRQTTRYQKLYAFGQEEVAPTLGIYGAFKLPGSALRVAGRSIGVLKSPEARARIGQALLPQKRILAEPDFMGFVKAVERKEILPKGPERIFAIQTEKINPDVLAKARELEGSDLIRSLSKPSIELYGAKSKALTIPDFIPKRTFYESYVMKQTRVIKPGENIEVVNQLIPKEKIKLRKLGNEQTLSETVLNVKKVELVGRGGIQVQKVATGIKPASQVELVGSSLKQANLPKPGKDFGSLALAEVKPEQDLLYRLSRAVRNELRLKGGIPEPEIPFMRSVYDKPDIAALPKNFDKPKQVELVLKEVLLPGSRITNNRGSKVFESLFVESRAKAIELKFFPESYKTQKFTRKGSLRESATYEFRVPEIEAAKAELRAIGEKYKGLRKIGPTESNPLFQKSSLKS